MLWQALLGLMVVYGIFEDLFDIDAALEIVLQMIQSCTTAIHA